MPGTIALFTNRLLAAEMPRKVITVVRAGPRAAGISARAAMLREYLGEAILVARAACPVFGQNPGATRTASKARAAGCPAQPRPNQLGTDTKSSTINMCSRCSLI